MNFKHMQVLSTTKLYHPGIYRKPIEIQKHKNNINRKEETLSYSNALSEHTDDPKAISVLWKHSLLTTQLNNQASQPSIQVQLSPRGPGWFGVFNSQTIENARQNCRQNIRGFYWTVANNSNIFNIGK